MPYVLVAVLCTLSFSPPCVAIKLEWNFQSRKACEEKQAMTNDEGMVCVPLQPYDESRKPSPEKKP